MSTISSPRVMTTTSRSSAARSEWRRRLLIGLVVGYMAILIIAPVAALAVGTVTQGLPAIIHALGDFQVLGAFWRTLVISVIAVVFHAIGGTALAWILVRQRVAGRNILNALIDLPFAISPVVAGYMLLLLFGQRGLLAPLMSNLGIRVAFALPGMILATLFVTLPFMVRELIPVLHAIGTEQENAAATLGATGWQTFRWVTFPALRHGFIYGLTLTFARALGEFGAVLVISGGVQGRTETATIYVFRALDDRQYAGAYSAALIIGLLSLIMIVTAELRLRRRHT